MKKFAAYIILSVLTMSAITSHAKTDTNLWRESDNTSNAVIAHDLWDDLLQAYLHKDKSGVNLFDYANVSQADDAKLRHYIDGLATLPIEQFNANEQLAFWINLYNALTVQVILDNYPVQSIRKIGGSFFSPGPWDQEVVSVDGESLTLNDIEHRIIRPVFGDKRIHYAVNCASIGCPNLSQKAYAGAELDQQLATAACEFIRHPRAVKIDGSRLHLSSIYKWYIEDFGDGVEDLRPHLAECLDPEDANRLMQLDLGFGKVKYQYDWNLNAF